MRAVTFSGMRHGALTVATAVLALAAVPVSAQQLQQQQQIPDSVQEIMAEYQEKQMELQAIQQQALQANEELREKESALEERIESEMRALDPEVDEMLDRFQAMRTEAEAAQAAQDNERVQEIMMEAQAMTGRLQEAQLEVVEQEEVQAAIEEYQAELLEEMKTIEPEVDTLVDRVEELAMRLRGGQAPD